MTDKKYKKPHPDAIQTKYGWALPKTGEVLVCRRDLPNPVEGFKPNRPFIVAEKAPVVKPEPKVEKPQKVEKAAEPVAEEPVKETKPARKTRVNAKSSK